MAITLDGTNGINSSGVIVAPDGSASAPSITNDGDTNTGIFFPAADTIAFAEGGAEAMRIDSSGNVGIGESTTLGKLHVKAEDTSVSSVSAQGNLLVLEGTENGLSILSSAAGAGYINFGDSGDNDIGIILYDHSSNSMRFNVNAAERARITSGGALLVGKTVTSFGTAGALMSPDGYGMFTVNADTTLYVNRLTNDGTLVSFNQAGVEEGTISVSGSTVSYNGGNLSRWAQMLTKPDLLKGTVMSNLDEMNVYVKPTLYWTEDDELPVDEEGNPTVAVGDVKQETSVSENEQLNKVKVSDVEGDANVAGVFVNWTYDDAHQVDEINMAMTGDMIIRIAQGVVVQKGDLLMSAGDGTAKPQGDDIVRSKTVAKVTSNHVTCTYADGSYCVPCVLMAC